MNEKDNIFLIRCDETDVLVQCIPNTLDSKHTKIPTRQVTGFDFIVKLPIHGILFYVLELHSYRATMHFFNCVQRHLLQNEEFIKLQTQLR